MGARGRALVSLYLDSIETILYIRRIVSACFSQCTAVPSSEALAACQALARGNMKVAGTWLWVGGEREARQRLKTSDIWLFCSLGTTTTSVSFSYLNLPCLPQFQGRRFEGRDLSRWCLSNEPDVWHFGLVMLPCLPYFLNRVIIIIWTTLRYLLQKKTQNKL